MKNLFRYTDSKIKSVEDITELEKNLEGQNLEFSSTFDLFRKIAEANPTAPAMIFLPSGALEAEPVKLTRQDLLDNIQQAANMFHGLGIGPTDVVSFLLPNFLEAHYTLWGAQAAGIVNPINFLLNQEQIVDICNAAKTRIIVALGPHPTLDIWQKVTALKDQVRTLEKVLIVGATPDSNENFLPFHQTISAYPKDHLTFDRDISEDDVACLFHTGGTTGMPKLVPHTHANEIAAARGTAQMYGMKEGDVLVNGLPLFHVAAPILLTLAPLGAGTEILIPSPAGLRDPMILENHWLMCQRYGVTIAGGVPTSLSDLTRIPLGNADISTIEFAIAGGAPLTSGLAKCFKSHANIDIHQIYGMTETSGAIAATPRNCRPVDGSVGMRLPGVEIKAVKLDQSGSWIADCEANETGILAVKGANIFSGYLHTKQTTNAFIGDDWLNTGDIGHIDSEGWIFLTGRAKDVIIRSSHNIDPASIEEVADRHPLVESSVAVGSPDVRAGEVPVVFVTIVPGETGDPTEICNYIKDNVPEKPAKPVAVIIIPQIPLTAIGKIYRPKLRCLAIEKLIEQELDDLFQGQTKITISVEDSSNIGISANVTVEESENDKQEVVRIISERLSHYAFSYTVT